LEFYINSIHNYAPEACGFREFVDQEHHVPLQQAIARSLWRSATLSSMEYQGFFPPLSHPSCGIGYHQVGFESYKESGVIDLLCAHIIMRRIKIDWE